MTETIRQRLSHTAIGIVCCVLFAVPSRAQMLVPVIPAAAAQPAEEIRDVDLESYLHARLAGGGGAQPAVFKALYATATPGVVAAELESSWLRFYVRLTAEDAVEPQTAYQAGDSALDDLVTTFARMSIAPQAQLDAKLARLGVRLEDVYQPATPPYYTNATGVVWSARQHRFVLLVRGVDDAAANRCFKAAIDLSNGDLITRASVPCSIE